MSSTRCHLRRVTKISQVSSNVGASCTRGPTNHRYYNSAISAAIAAVTPVPPDYSTFYADSYHICSIYIPHYLQRHSATPPLCAKCRSRLQRTAKFTRTFNDSRCDPAYWCNHCKLVRTGWSEIHDRPTTQITDVIQLTTALSMPCAFANDSTATMKMRENVFIFFYIFKTRFFNEKITLLSH